jgi:hypothetical protein
LSGPHAVTGIDEHARRAYGVTDDAIVVIHPTAAWV